VHFAAAKSVVIPAFIHKPMATDTSGKAFSATSDSQADIASITDAKCQWLGGWTLSVAGGGGGR